MCRLAFRVNVYRTALYCLFDFICRRQKQRSQPNSNRSWYDSRFFRKLKWEFWRFGDPQLDARGELKGRELVVSIETQPVTSKYP